MTKCGCALRPRPLDAPASPAWPALVWNLVSLARELSPGTRTRERGLGEEAKVDSDRFLCFR